MFYLFFIFAVLLVLGLLLSVLTEGRFAVWAKAYRIIVVAVTIVFFATFFTKKSLSSFLENSLAVQIINKLPFPLDFYLIKVNDDPSAEVPYETQHLGKIRNNYYRVEYLQMSNSHQYWLIGYMGKKNLVYFSQHSVPNKNEDQIVEVRNYIVQSSRLSETARSQIDRLKFDNIKTAIWIALDLLLIFLNFALLFRKIKEKSRNLVREM